MLQPQAQLQVQPQPQAPPPDQLRPPLFPSRFNKPWRPPRLLLPRRHTKLMRSYSPQLMGCICIRYQLPLLFPNPQFKSNSKPITIIRMSRLHHPARVTTPLIPRASSSFNTMPAVSYVAAKPVSSLGGTSAMVTPSWKRRAASLTPSSSKVIAAL